MCRFEPKLFRLNISHFCVTFLMIMVPFLLVESKEDEVFYPFNIDLKGYIEFESRYFPKKDRKQISSNTNQSLAASLELYLDHKQRDWSLLFSPFLRIDQRDSARSILDLNEFYLAISKPSWELKLGSKQLFWGVLESNHLVDIINQTNSAENIDQEDKLGQPMLNFTLIDGRGTLDVFLMTGNRKRRFVSEEGRPHNNFERILKTGVFEPNKSGLDYVFRYENSSGIFDIGIYYFNGLARDPIIIPETRLLQTELTATYPNIEQIAIDLQITVKNTLFKLEGLFRESRVVDYGAFGIGFEHTFYGILNSKKDLGLLLEYHWDQRNDESVGQFSNDLFSGMRLRTNEADDGQLLLGILNNFNDSSVTAFVEASKRLPNNWKFYLEGRLFSLLDPGNPLSDLDDDSYLQFVLTKFF